MSTIRFEVLKEGFEPVLATDGSGGFDLKACTEAGVVSHYSEDINDLVPTGVKAAIPEGYVGLLFPRSGKGHKEGMRLGNTVGVIDSDYRGEIFVSVQVDGRGTEGGFCNIASGERFAQMVVVPVLTAHEFVSSLDDTERGEGGFGSSGS